MADITLLTSTGVQKVDEIILGFIGLVELSFPDQVRSYYLEGSYIDGTAVSTSDIDLTLVFKDNLTDEEEHRFQQLLEYCWLLSSFALDINTVGEAELLQRGAVSFKIASLLMYGEDIRGQVPLAPLETFTRRMMHAPYHFFSRVRSKP